MKRWAPVLLYMGLIFAVSHQPLEGVLPPVNHFDKVAHFFAYALLGALVLRGIGRVEPAGWVVISTFLAAVYGVSDEVHQSFVVGRDASVGDAVADALGAAAGSGVFFWWRRTRGRSQ